MLRLPRLLPMAWRGSRSSRCVHTSDKICLKGMSFGGYHGVLPFEREIGQRFIVDVELLVDLAAAGASDDLHETLNYAEVYAEVKRVVEGPPHRDLIEAVAHDVAQSVLVCGPRCTAGGTRFGLLWFGMHPARGSVRPLDARPKAWGADCATHRHRAGTPTVSPGYRQLQTLSTVLHERPHDAGPPPELHPL